MAVMIGAMNRCVSFEKKISTADEAGQPQETWKNIGGEMAAVETLNTREAFSARQAGVVVTHKVTIWYRRDVHANAPLWRLNLEGRILNIVSAVETMGTRQLELLCAEVQPWGNQGE
jgi:SPP1 family predicted phage head-tail adaptor